MAHTVTGIDLGTWSVKFVVVEVGFRASRQVTAFEEQVPPGDEPLLERQGDALQAGLARLPGGSTAYVALPGEMLAVRVLDLPFADVRKVDQVVGYELEGQIVHALQDVVFDHAVLEPRGEGSSVLAAAARIDEVGDFLANLGIRGVEPRALFAAPVVYQSLFGSGKAAAAADDLGCQVLIDVGHGHTNVCVLSRGETVYARTLTRGGQALTAAIAEAFCCDAVKAEDGKREHGFIGSAALPPDTQMARRMDAALRQALVPWLRDLRQTLASFRARDKAPIEGVLLTGGGAGLRGLPEYLEEELGLPVERFAPGADGDGRYALASAIAWAGARGGKELDFRRGPYQYKASFSVLRQRAAHLGALAAAVVICATIDGTMALARLSKQKEALQAQLRAATTELFGEPRMDAKAVALLLKRGFRDEMAPIPKATAFDLLDQISRKMPPNDKVKLDIQEIDIKPKKITMMGTVDSASAVEELSARLREIECIEDVAKGGPITEMSGGAKKFSLNIASKCP